MSNKVQKQLRLLAATLATSGQDSATLVKQTTKVYSNLSGNNSPYTVDQVVNHPKGVKAALSFVKKAKKEDLPLNNLKELFDLESTAKLSTLASNGYVLV